MKPSKPHKVFVEGAISSGFIADSIAKHSTKLTIGAHNIFLGQVRNDVIDGRGVVGIEYTTYRDMAEEMLHDIREDMFSKYSLVCLHTYHSLGLVMAGEINLFVFASSKHRHDSIEACREIVERMKHDVPIWGREIFDDEHHQWKTNT